MATGGMIATREQHPDVRHDEENGYPRQNHQLTVRSPVSAAFALGDHLGLCGRQHGTDDLPMIAGKLSAVSLAIFAAIMMMPKILSRKMPLRLLKLLLKASRRRNKQ